MMKTKLILHIRQHPDSWSILIIAIFMFGYSININWKNGQWQNVLKADAKGYYAYLPAVFIYKDLNFNFYEKTEIRDAYDTNLIYDYRYNYKGHIIDKYFAGEAVLLMPFFLAAHFITLALGLPPDGYSRFYMISVTIASIFYLCLGLFFLKKTLKLFTINELTIMLVVVATALGSNLFYYSVAEPGMTHVFSFFLVSSFHLPVDEIFPSLLKNDTSFMLP